MNMNIEDAERNLREGVEAFVRCYVDTWENNASEVSVLGFADAFYRFLELDVVDEQRRIARENGKGFTPEIEQAMYNAHKNVRTLIEDFGA